jgi:hypothetical protein
MINILFLILKQIFSIDKILKSNIKEIYQILRAIKKY